MTSLNFKNSAKRTIYEVFVLFLTQILSSFKHDPSPFSKRVDKICGQINCFHGRRIIKDSKFLVDLGEGQFACRLPNLTYDDAPPGTPSGPPLLKGKAGKRARKAFLKKSLRILLNEVMETNLSYWLFSDRIKANMRTKFISLIEKTLV